MRTCKHKLFKTELSCRGCRRDTPPVKLQARSTCLRHNMRDARHIRACVLIPRAKALVPMKCSIENSRCNGAGLDHHYSASEAAVVDETVSHFRLVADGINMQVAVAALQISQRQPRALPSIATFLVGGLGTGAGCYECPMLKSRNGLCTRLVVESTLR